MLPGEVVITNQINKALQFYFNGKKYSKIAVLVDENTLRHCYPLVKKIIPEHLIITISSGESHKQLATCEKIWLALTKAEFDRKSLMINIGGGVIGDMGGFCAATYKRGINFINLPTTLLAQVDASVGGKLGIDFYGFKNHIGVFNSPDSVIIFPEFLKTLPSNEVRSGFAEVIKHHLIYDAKAWPTLVAMPFEKQPWEKIIHHSTAIKETIVEQDPLEGGLRKILNFGHTIGHAIESFFLEIPGEKLLHGEAIAIGMVAESFISMERSGLSSLEYEQISNYIIGQFSPKVIDETNFKAISDLALQDKKNEGGKINCTLLSTIGNAVFDVTINAQDIYNGLSNYNTLLADRYKESN